MVTCQKNVFFFKKKKKKNKLQLLAVSIILSFLPIDQVWIHTSTRFSDLLGDERPELIVDLRRLGVNVLLQS